MMRLPQHLAFIMDGNGRWAQERGLPRSAGHKAGYEHISRVLEMCNDLGVRIVSGYAWSTENWGRPKPEVEFIMNALEKHLPRFIAELHDRNVRFMHCGTSDNLSPAALKVLKEGEALTHQNSSGVFNLVFNYGGRAEIVHAARQLVKNRVRPENICEKTVGETLWTAGLPDVDLVFRTGGDWRMSNFLLWQSAYACIYIADVYWPALSRDEIEKGILVYAQSREQSDREFIDR
jgi:undecaprenyl diphosphate synthase